MVDAVERNRQHPATFQLPSPAELENVRVGDHVKLIWERTTEDGGERMWVRIDSHDAGVYTGRLANVPVRITELSLGQTVQFERRHIIAV